MGKELRTRYKIQEEVKILSVIRDEDKWAIGWAGLIRRVWFDLFGLGFVVEVCRPLDKKCVTIECRKVKKIKSLSETLVEDRR
jgi:hypothetical protein